MQSVFRSLVCAGIAVAFLVLVAGCGGGGGTGPDPVDNPPAPPSGLTATEQVGGVTLEWQAVGADDLEGYNVYRNTASFNSIANREPLNGAPLSETTVRDDAVENGALYYYRISAVDNAGNEGNPSDEIAVTVFPSPPDRP
jgi:fibronectin type 3 domain-containing protein